MADRIAALAAACRAHDRRRRREHLQRSTRCWPSGWRHESRWPGRSTPRSDGPITTRPAPASAPLELARRRHPGRRPLPALGDADRRPRAAAADCRSIRVLRLSASHSRLQDRRRDRSPALSGRRTRLRCAAPTSASMHRRSGSAPQLIRRSRRAVPGTRAVVLQAVGQSPAHGSTDHPMRPRTRCPDPIAHGSHRCRLDTCSCATCRAGSALTPARYACQRQLAALRDESRTSRRVAVDGGKSTIPARAFPRPGMPRSSGHIDRGTSAPRNARIAAGSRAGWSNMIMWPLSSMRTKRASRAPA